jgi:hypothetical protein
MYGPQPDGFWSAHTAVSRGVPFQLLTPGREYRVVKEFADHDGTCHLVGEEWVFLGHSFVPYDDGMSFFVSLDGRQEWLIPLQWRPEEQSGILDALGEYVREV